MCTGKLQFLSTEFSTSRYDQPVYISSSLKSSFLFKYIISLLNVSGCLPVLVSISLYTKESGCIILTRSMITLSDSPVNSQFRHSFSWLYLVCPLAKYFLSGAHCKIFPQLRYSGWIVHRLGTFIILARKFHQTVSALLGSRGGEAQPQVSRGPKIIAYKASLR